jgi:hypothetical protein
MATISTHLPETIDYVCLSLGINELHFAEIYSGKGSLRDVPFEKRLDAFRVFARVFTVFRLPVIVQTFSPDNILDQKETLKGFGKVAGLFDLQDPSDLAFVMLLSRIGDFIAQNKEVFHKPALTFVDEGRFKSGLAVHLGQLLYFAHQSALFFASSKDCGLLQLADFAAFGINRMQWLLAKPDRTETDERLLEILIEADFQGIDMYHVQADSLDAWTQPTSTLSMRGSARSGVFIRFLARVPRINTIPDAEYSKPTDCKPVGFRIVKTFSIDFAEKHVTL